MGSSGANIIGSIFSFYFVIAFFSSFYFWAKKTDRSQAPIQRRMIATGFALAWPFFVFRSASNKSNQASREADRRAAEQRILGGGPASPSAGTGPTRPAPQVSNPFDA